MQPTVPMREVWTFEDLEDLEFEHPRQFQILDGALLVSPSAAVPHEYVSALVRDAIQSQLPDELITLGPLGVAMSTSYLIPDLLVMPKSHYREAAHLDPEDAVLVVEVVSPGSVSIDRLVKPAKYAAAGIPNFWRVETKPLSLTVYELAGGADVYTEVRTWRPGDTAELTRPVPMTVEVAALEPPTPR